MTRRAAAAAKLNLALVVGPQTRQGKHEVTTVLQRVDLADRVSVAPARALEVTGFRDDTLVRRALTELAAAADVAPAWQAAITKRIPVAAGLGGGSSDAATALRLANATLERPLPRDRLARLAASLGADLPFFLTEGPQLGEGDGSRLSPLALPQDYWTVIVLPSGVAKASTAAVYRRFDARRGSDGYADRRERLLTALGCVAAAEDLALLPPNDLASSPLEDELRAAGAFRADVTGAGPAVYGLFTKRRDALAARQRMQRAGRAWITVPAWYF